MRLIDADKIKKDFSEVLERDYEDDYAKGFKAALVAVLRYKTISQPHNDPLTLEELLEMDGEPVWVVFAPDTDGERLAIWVLISADKENNEIFLLNSIGGSSDYEEVWEDIEAIYRRKPEEERK